MKNDNYNNNLSIIKILNKDFLFKNYFEIPDENIDIKCSEKFFINEDEKEDSSGINISNEKNNILNNYSPIYIKRDNKLFLVGIVNEEKKYIILIEKN